MAGATGRASRAESRAAWSPGCREDVLKLRGRKSWAQTASDREHSTWLDRRAQADHGALPAVGRSLDLWILVGFCSHLPCWS